MRLRNNIYTGANGRESLIDLCVPISKEFKVVVLFVHGYKGFKDWGCWNLVESYFEQNNIGFCKLNLSHNGGTLENPIDFPDLEAFGENRYTYELEDIREGIDWLYRNLDMTERELFLLGHSRGGGDVILAAEDERVKGIITWASISDIGSRFPAKEELLTWNKRGVRYIENKRTKQQMPHYYTFYQDWYFNQDALNIEKLARHIQKPCLHIHGNKDEAVAIEESKQLSEWTKGIFITIEGANHTFGTVHPWYETYLPKQLEETCKITCEFIKSNL